MWSASHLTIFSPRSLTDSREVLHPSSAGYHSCLYRNRSEPCSDTSRVMYRSAQTSFTRWVSRTIEMIIPSLPPPPHFSSHALNPTVISDITTCASLPLLGSGGKCLVPNTAVVSPANTVFHSGLPDRPFFFLYARSVISGWVIRLSMPRGNPGERFSTSLTQVFLTSLAQDLHRLFLSPPVASQTPLHLKVKILFRKSAKTTACI